MMPVLIELVKGLFGRPSGVMRSEEGDQVPGTELKERGTMRE